MTVVLVAGLLTFAALALHRAFADQVETERWIVRGKRRNNAPRRGRARGRSYAVHFLDDGDRATGQRRVRIEVRLPKGLRDLRLTHEGLFASDDLRTGDAAFDKAIAVTGTAAESIVALDRKARARILKLVPRGKFSLAGGVITFESSWSERAIGPLVDELALLANGLKPGAHERALAQRAVSDDLPEVRARALELLLRRAPTGRNARLAATECLRCDVPELEALAWNWAFEHATPAVIDREIPLALDRGNLVVLAAIATHLAAQRDARHAGRLLRYAPTAGPVLGPALGQYVNAVASKLAAEKFTMLLERSIEPSLLLAVVESVGSFGDVEHVEGLLAVAKSQRSVRNAARAAVLEIQRRLGSVDAGRLTLAEQLEETGAVSVAAEEGAISVEGAAERRVREG